MEQAEQVSGDTGLVLISIGGNDVGFTTVLMKCIFWGEGFSLLAENPCYPDNKLGTSRQDYFDGIADKIFSTGLHDIYFKAIDKIVDRLDWNEQKGTEIYQTGQSWACCRATHMPD